MGREVPFKTDATCDGCGASGAYDFMGDYLCQKCSDAAIDNDFVDIPDALKSELECYAPQPDFEGSRRDAMIALRRSGWTLEKIGHAFCLGKQRVSQIVNTPDREGRK